MTQPGTRCMLPLRGRRDHVGERESQVPVRRGRHSVSHEGQDRAVTEIPDWLSSTLAADASKGSGAMPTWIHALSPEATVVGPALVVSVSRDDNRPMREIPATGPGTILVVAGGSESRTAILGDLIARELIAAGIVAVVTDGLIRDSLAVAELGLPVWARGVTPVASAKDGPGQVGGSVTLGGVMVRDGDLVVADADGVVVWSVADITDLIAAADVKRTADDERLAAMTAPPG
jgi:4-hydroxy-4-methyl-2-oxoglutarate aldolase